MPAVAAGKRIADKTGIFFLKTAYFNNNVFIASESGNVRELGNQFQSERFSIQNDISCNDDKNMSVYGFKFCALILRINNLFGDTVLAAGFAIPEMIAQGVRFQVVIFKKIGLAVAGRNKTNNLESIAKRFYFFNKFVKGIYVLYCRLLHDHVPFGLEMLLERWHTKFFPSIKMTGKFLMICSRYQFSIRASPF